MQIRGHFWDFLRLRGVLDRYALNAAQQNNSIASIVENRGPHAWIMSAFIFEGTPEGTDFWLEVDESWCNCVDALRKEDKL